MEKKRKQSQEVSLTDAYSLFVYAIRTQITRDYYLRRLRTFFDYIKLLPNANIDRRCNHFAVIAVKDHNWTFSKIIGFLQFQKLAQDFCHECREKIDNGVIEGYETCPECGNISK